jgi:hypothetical protein
MSHLCRPHRTSTDGKFYIRAGDDFLPAPIGMLGHMFFPYAKVDFRIGIVFDHQMHPSDRHGELSYRVLLSNAGTATAVSPVLAAASSFGLQKSHPQCETYLAHNWREGVAEVDTDLVRSGAYHMFAGPSRDLRDSGVQRVFFSDAPIHPGMTQAVFRVSRKVDTTQRYGPDGVTTVPVLEGASFTFTVMATNCEPATFTAQIDADLIRVRGPHQLQAAKRKA